MTPTEMILRYFEYGHLPARAMLHQDLVREGIADHAEGRTTTTTRVGGRVQRVLRLRRAALAGLAGSDEFPDQAAAVTAVTDVTGSGE